MCAIASDAGRVVGRRSAPFNAIHGGGEWNRAKTWHTSSGFSNSTIPQPLERPARTHRMRSSSMVSLAFVLRCRRPGARGFGSRRLTAWLSGHVAIDHRSSIAEVILQILPGRAPGQIADEAPASNLRQVADGSSFGFLVWRHGESRPFHRLSG